MGNKDMALPSDRAGGLRPEPAAQSQPEALIPSAGDVYRVRYPFVRCDVTLLNEDGPYETKSWRPGVNIELCGPWGEDADIVANGEGEMVLTVVDVHKPGRFPTRVFYTRQFVSPNGHTFGKRGLRMTTVEAFKRRAAGFKLAYDVEDAQGIEAATADETGTGSAVGESPVAESEAPNV